MAAVVRRGAAPPRDKRALAGAEKARISGRGLHYVVPNTREDPVLAGLIDNEAHVADIHTLPEQADWVQVVKRCVKGQPPHLPEL